jgi:hypothetical protein
MEEQPQHHPGKKPEQHSHPRREQIDLHGVVVMQINDEALIDKIFENIGWVDDDPRREVESPAKA